MNVPPAATSTPEAPAPDMLKTPDAIFDAAVARANNPEAAAPAVTPEPEAQPEAKPAAKTEIPVDPEMLKTVTTLQRSKRELETKLKELEAKIKSADSFAEIEKLWKEGKKLDAIAKLEGKEDSIAAFEAVLKDYVDAPETTAESKVEAQLKAMADKLAESDKRFADAEKKREEAEKTLQQRQQEQERNQALAYATSKIDPEKFELCAKEENRAEMAETALEAVPLLARAALKEQLGHEPTAEEMNEAMASMTADDWEPFFINAYTKLEAELEEMGKRYQKKAKAAPQPEPERESTPAKKPAAKPVTLSRPSVSTTKPPSKPMTPDDLFEAAQKRANELATR